MSDRQRVDVALGEFGASCGLPGLALDENDRATLAIGGVPVTFLYQAAPLEMVSLYAELGEIPEFGTDAPEFLLQLGLGSWVAGHMTIGLDRDGKSVLGHAVIPASRFSQQTLTETLQRLLAVARPLRERIAERDFRLELPETDANDRPSDQPVV